MQQEAMPAGTMHMRDVKAIYAVKGYLLANLDKPPNIAALAREAGMSGPKLRKLFKQTFGKGIFAYYQAARMQKAAKLLKDKRLSVTEAGYQLGFTNLSHFTRVFEQYIGMKPKRFSVEGGMRCRVPLGESAGGKKIKSQRSKKIYKRRFIIHL